MARMAEVTVSLLNWVGLAELTGKDFKSSGGHLRCELNKAMRTVAWRAELPMDLLNWMGLAHLMGKDFKSPKVHLRCKLNRMSKL